MYPPYQQRGVPVSPSAFNMLLDVVKTSVLNGITGGTFSRSINGTTINVTQNAGGASSASTPVCQYFQVTNATETSVLKVEVAQNLIAGRWPDGMGLNFPPFLLTISGNSYIYAKVMYNTTTLQILPESDAITIFQTSDIQANTTDSVYILIATVTVGGSPVTIQSINNVCTQPQPNPCTLAWTS
jgi:hypothetical protein